MLENLQAYTEECVERFKIPAVSIAVLHNDQFYQGAAGVLNIDTGVKATTDSIFQIGSISKIFTATLVMQLVDEGKVELDHPVKAYLNDFHVACPEATESITVRQLLSHTSGMAGDLFPRENAQDYDLGRYIDRCYLLPQLHPPGEFFSYCNAGYCMAGRLVEVITGLPWPEAVLQRIVKPLGMEQVAVRPSGTLRYRSAMGHTWPDDGKKVWKPAGDCYFPLSMASVGATLSMSALDVLRFAKAHMMGGEQSNQWLSQAAICQMQAPQCSLPDYSPEYWTDIGLGWALHRRADKTEYYGHDGGVIGQCSLLRVIPEHNTILAILVNCDSREVLDAVFAELLKPLTGITYQEVEPTGKATDLAGYCGVYESLGEAFDVRIENDELVAVNRLKIIGAEPEHLSLKPIDNGAFAVYRSNGMRRSNISFLQTNEKGQTEYLFSFNGRLCPRSC